MPEQDRRIERQQIDPTRSPEERVGLLRSLVERAVLTWKLIWDPRVGFFPKLIPALGLVYIISPIDLIPELVAGPLGLTDDLGVLLLVLTLFVQAAPTDVVREHLRELRRRRAEADEDDQVVEGYAEQVDE